MPATIVITGAGRGIGAATAQRLAGLPGARLALVARSADQLEAVAAACRRRGAEALALPADVTDERAVNAAAAVALDRFGAPDLLVSNAGAFRPGTLLETSPAEFRAQVEVNLTSGFLVTRAFLPPMLERRRGLIVYVGSVASVRAYPSGAAYCAAKHGLLGLARSVREETKPHGLRVTALLPGATLTESWASTDLPEERFIAPEDIAEVIAGLYALSGRAVVEELLVRPQQGDL